MMEDGSGGSKFHQLLGRALTDHEFRGALMDPNQRVQALESMGIEPNEEVLEALDRAINALDYLAKSEALGGDSVAVA